MSDDVWDQREALYAAGGFSPLRERPHPTPPAEEGRGRAFPKGKPFTIAGFDQTLTLFAYPNFENGMPEVTWQHARPEGADFWRLRNYVGVYKALRVCGDENLTRAAVRACPVLTRILDGAWAALREGGP